MRIFILTGPGPDWAPYLEAALLARGLAFTETIDARDVAAIPAKPSVLILTPGSDAVCSMEAVQAFLERGGHAVAFAPGTPLLQLAGLEDRGSKPAPVRMRIIRPAASYGRGHTLPVPGNVRLLHPADRGTVHALLYQPGVFPSESLGIVEIPVGRGGMTLFAYDFPQCLFRLRQGDPERAGFIPPDDGVQRPSHLFAPVHGETDAWTPVADLHLGVLCDLLRRSLGRCGPVPALWHIPRGKASALIYSGDEDHADVASNDAEMKDLERHEGAMTLFVIPDSTHSVREHVRDYARRGHAVSVHPNLHPASKKSDSEQIQQAVSQIALFREKFGLGVRTVRNHMTIWPGFTEIPALWEREGIRMDTNYFGSRLMQCSQVGPYSGPAGCIPLPFARPDGRLFRVWQQPTSIADDLWFHPTVDYSMKISPEQFEVIGRRLFEDSTQCFHEPLCVCIHPGNYTRYSGPQGRSLMRLAREFDWPILSVDQWLEFWECRDSWRLADYEVADRQACFTCRGRPGRGFCIHLPARWGPHKLSEVRLDGSKAEPAFRSCFQEDSALIPLPEAAPEVEVAVSY
ncbi:MAG: hypothetical protein HYU36_18195 [Planctomycetes bacterium]|nr:hypothetical protein [Planctomycetota bacterium]